MQESPVAWRMQDYNRRAGSHNPDTRPDPVAVIRQALEDVRTVNTLTAPGIANAMHHLQGSLSAGRIGTIFANAPADHAMAVSIDIAKSSHKDLSTAIARAVGAVSTDMLVVQTSLDAAWNKHEYRRLDAVAAPGNDAAKAVSDAMRATGDALTNLARRGADPALTRMIVHNIPRCEKFLAEQQHPFPSEMALVLAAQYTVEKYRERKQALVDHETVRRAEGPSYRREQATLEANARPFADAAPVRRYDDSEDAPAPMDTMAEDIAGPPSKRQLARAALQPFKEAIPVLNRALAAMKAAEEQYPDSMRRRYDQVQAPVIAPQYREAPSKRQDSPAEVPLAALLTVSKMPLPALHVH